MAELVDLKAALTSLRHQALIDQAKEVIVLAGSHVGKEVLQLLETEYPWLIVKTTSKLLDYIDAKDAAIRIATGEIVVLIDSDVRYQKDWLKNLLQVFLDCPEAEVVAGDTRAEVTSAYTMGINLAWMFLIRPQTTTYTQITSFAFNNFAIKKAAYRNVVFPARFPLYRGKGTILYKNLLQHGVNMYRTSQARAFHAVPQNLTDWWYRMLINGHDFIAMGDFQFKDGQVSEHKSFLKRLRNFILWTGWKALEPLLNAYRLVSSEPTCIKYLPGGLLLGLVNYLVMCLGSLITLIHRDFLYNLVSAYEERHQV